MKSYDVIVIGAGPAGLTAAYHLTKKGKKVLVLEKHPDKVGGISRTESYKSFLFDIGGHRFYSKSQEIVDLWHEMLPNDFMVRQRKSRIYFNETFFPYPLKLLPTLENLGLKSSFLCVISYLKAQMFPKKPEKTYQDWVVNRFGNQLFKTFFESYTEKVWGMKCNEISADWAAQRIQSLSMRSVLLSFLSPFFNKNDKHKTLIQEFLYPRKGPGMLWESAKTKIIQNGNEVLLNANVENITYDENEQLYSVKYKLNEKDINTVKSKHVISSMPLTTLVHAMPDELTEDVKRATTHIKYRDFLIVALIIDDDQTFDDQWIYIHDPNVSVGRIQNFKAWSEEMVPDPSMTCLGMEYFCNQTDEFWNMNDSDIIAHAKKELVQIGLQAADKIKDGYVIRQEKAYPVYDDDYKAHVKTIKGELEKLPNFQTIGRNGLHQYNNQDHSMLTGIMAANNICDPANKKDVWQLNEKLDYIEETANTSTSGLRATPQKVVTE